MSTSVNAPAHASVDLEACQFQPQIIPSSTQSVSQISSSSRTDDSYVAIYPEEADTNPSMPEEGASNAAPLTRKQMFLNYLPTLLSILAYNIISQNWMVYRDGHKTRFGWRYIQLLLEGVVVYWLGFAVVLTAFESCSNLRWRQRDAGERVEGSEVLGAGTCVKRRDDTEVVISETGEETALLSGAQE